MGEFNGGAVSCDLVHERGADAHDSIVEASTALLSLSEQRSHGTAHGPALQDAEARRAKSSCHPRAELVDVLASLHHDPPSVDCTYVVAP